MRILGIILICLIWMVRLRALSRTGSLRGKKFLFRLWIENSVAVGILIPVAAGLTSRPLWSAAGLAIDIGLGFGAIVTAVMYMWGLRRSLLC